MVGLGALSGGSFYSQALGVSADGSVVVGQSSSTPGYQAFRWTATNGMVGLGDLPGGSYYSIALAISADGRVIVGESSSTLAPTYDEAFCWTVTNGMVGLGKLPGGNARSQAFAVSANGSVIVGASGSSNATSGVWEAFRWTAAEGMMPLGDIPGGITNSVAYGISSDGSVVVGRGISFTDSQGFSTEQACQWTFPNHVVPLGFLPCDTWSVAHAASADGSVIVGDPSQGSGDCVFIWDFQHGIRNLHAVLANDYGLNLAGWQLSEAHAITPDGKTIVGFGTDPAGKTEAWMANITPPELTIRRSETSVILSWGTNTSGFLLETNASLSASNLWKTNSAMNYILGTNFVVTNIISAGQQFFRLSKP